MAAQLNPSSIDFRLLMKLPIWFVVLVSGTMLSILIAMIARRFMHEEESGRLLDWPEVGLKGEVGGASPVQGTGTIGEYSFTFYAKHDGWIFELMERRDDPWNTPPGDCLFRLEGEAAGSSYMDFDDAEQIIRDCVTQFQLRDRNLCRDAESSP
jgi:hypothetical protein